MLLNNNGPSDTTAIQPSGGNVVFRRQKQESERHNNNGSGGSSSSSKKKGKGAGGGTSSVRNSWSFTSELPIQHHVPIVPIKENIYVDPETLMNGNGDLKAVSRSRLRQRSVSNLNAAALAGTRSRDHSSSNRHPNGTMAKGVDYIRVHINPVRAGAPLSVHQPTEMTTTTILPTEDRSEYGNPDGSSAHSTAERESGVVGGNNMLAKTGQESCLVHPGMDLYQAINQNQSNDYKLIQGYVMQPETAADPNSNRVESQSHPAMVRHGSGRGSATNARGGGQQQQHFPSSSTTTTTATGSTGKTSAEVHASRKPAAAGAPVPTSTGPNAVKTEWTFLPSPTANTTEPQHREINSKPEESSMVRKGLLWVMRDRIFSRYHERFCILTRNYLHCFKKGSEASLTQMGNFLFKVNLAEVIAVQWLDKRGTAIVCLTLAKEGRLLLKTSMDLNGWFDDLQCCVKETIGRRQTLLMDQRGRTETFTSSPVSAAVPQQQRPAQQQTSAAIAVYRDRSLAARNNRPTNRYSLMSDHEAKLTSVVGIASAENADNGHSTGGVLSAEPQSLGNYAVPAQVTSSTPPPAVQSPPVPVPYRERSVSFDRSRASKAEREAKRRSYYPSNHVTQV